MYYLNSRYYSPKLGRFLTKDSIDFIDIRYPDTLNGYTYAYNNPINYVDPKGQFAFVAAIAAALAPEEVAVAAAVGTAAVAATVELAKEAKGAWDRYRSTFNPPLIHFDYL